MVKQSGVARWAALGLLLLLASGKAQGGNEATRSAHSGKALEGKGTSKMAPVGGEARGVEEESRQGNFSEERIAQVFLLRGFLGPGGGGEGGSSTGDMEEGQGYGSSEDNGTSDDDYNSSGGEDYGDGEVDVEAYSDKMERDVEGVTR